MTKLIMLIKSLFTRKNKVDGAGVGLYVLNSHIRSTTSKKYK